MTSLGISFWRAVLVPPPPGGGGGLGTPTFVATSSASAAGDVTCSVPTGVLDGDIMIAWHVTSNNQVITTPSGWTLILESGGAGTERLRSYWRRASSEPASHLWDSNLSNNNSVGITAYRDCIASGSPIDGTPTTNTATNVTVTATGITTSNDNTMLVMGVWVSGTRTFNDGTSSLGNERLDGVGGISLGVFDGLQATAGASGNETVTLSSSSGWFAQLIGIKPSGGT